jgi:hypothetical protein
LYQQIPPDLQFDGVQGLLVLRWLEGYMAFSMAYRAPSSIWSPVYTDYYYYDVMPYVILLLLLHDAIWMEGKYTIAYGAQVVPVARLNAMVAVSAEP